MQLVPIKSRGEYKRVLKEIERLMHARRNTAEGDRLEALVKLVEIWEEAEERFLSTS